jgi:hypothetical protein
MKIKKFFSKLGWSDERAVEATVNTELMVPLELRTPVNFVLGGRVIPAYVHSGGKHADIRVSDLPGDPDEFHQVFEDIMNEGDKYRLVFD